MHYYPHFTGLFVQVFEKKEFLEKFQVSHL